MSQNTCARCGGAIYWEDRFALIGQWLHDDPADDNDAARCPDGGIGFRSRPQQLAEAMRRFGEAISAAGGDDISFRTPIVATALSLYESLYGELSLHMPELPEERREFLAEFMVRRLVRDHSEVSSIAERKRQGIDNTQDESAIVKSYLDRYASPAEAERDEIAGLFPLEYAEWCEDKEQRIR